MGIILDIILVAIVIISLVYGAKKGFFKSLMSLLSGVASLIIAYTFTPPLSNFIKDRFLVDSVARSLSKTFGSVAEAGKDSAGNMIYDLSRLLENSQFAEAAERAGLSAEELVAMTEGEGSAAIDALAYSVAEPLAKAVGEILAFIIIFIIAFVLLKLATYLIGLVFELPVLRTLDRSLGLIFGGIGALFFVWVFSMAAASLVDALANVAPSSFGTEIIEGSLLVELFAKLNPVAALTQLLSKNA